MIQPGRVCVKIAGRDGNLKCVVVENLDKNYVLVDGLTRRRKCNIAHLEPLNQTLNIGRGSHEEVVQAFKEIGVEIKNKVKKEKSASQKTSRVQTKEKTEKKSGKSSEAKEKLKKPKAN